MSKLKKFFIGLVVVLIVIQFIHPQKNISNSVLANRITAPKQIQNILATSCNDCHSNNTVYPWYNNIQPVAWWLGHHINEAKEKLNFDEFAAYSLRRQYHKLEEVEEMINEIEMPLTSYAFIHRNAILSAQQKHVLIDWTKNLRKEMEAKYPIDSLIRKQQKPKAL